MSSEYSKHEKHLRVYGERSEYHSTPEQIEIFKEGVSSVAARHRLKKIKDAFEGGFLEEAIQGLKKGSLVFDTDKICVETQSNLHELVGLVTSEVGRALIGLTVMQLSIKSIVPDQSIRLHKSSIRSGSFSWVDGVSMRTLDKKFVTPILRKHDLVRLNADGFMMTRSLAENYPYSQLYKAQLRGARVQWLSVVDSLENGGADPKEALLFMLSLLLNSAKEFSDAADFAVNTCDQRINGIHDQNDVLRVLARHADASDYAARLLEVAMHSLMQAAVESGALGELELKPLSQMRSANKKHGNVGDIELLDGGEIVEAWDAKYGKGYLREEIEEAAEKISSHEHLSLVGFVTSVPIQRVEELRGRMDDLFELHGVRFLIMGYEEWVGGIFRRCSESGIICEAQLAKEWLRAYVYTLAQRKRNVAPIDEPCLEWIRLIQKELERL